MKKSKADDERRKWPRLPLAIPVFVRTKDAAGKEFLEFATAMNISASGALVALRRALPPSTRLSLEIPSPPLSSAADLPAASRTLEGRVVRASHSGELCLHGVRFNQALVKGSVRAAKA